MDVDRPYPWMLATTKDTLEPDIVFAAHLDVVPGTDDLFALRNEDGKLYGRGVYDMKFAVACYLELLDKHATELKKLNVGFLFTTDEEDGGMSAFDIMATGFRPGVIFLPDGGDDWNIEGRAKGLLGVELTASGKAAHGSRPWEGENALHRIMDVTTALREAYPYRGKDEATLSINGIQGGEVFNQIPATVKAFIDFRSFDSAEIQQFLDHMHALCAEHDVTATLRSTGEPVIFDPAHPNAQSFLRTFEAFTGKPVTYTDSYGGTDARYFATENIPSIVMNPTGGSRHANDEWLVADDLQRFYELLAQWLEVSEKKMSDSLVADEDDAPVYELALDAG